MHKKKNDFRVYYHWVKLNKKILLIIKYVYIIIKYLYYFIKKYLYNIYIKLRVE